MAAFGSRHRKRKLKSEINAVPYIDVVLVLLVILMLSATVLNLGVQVNLPQSNVRPVDPPENPVLVSIDAQGGFSLRVGEGESQVVSAEELSRRMRAFIASDPEIPVFVAADRELRYQVVMDAMELLQAAGVSRAALMTEPRQAGR